MNGELHTPIGSCIAIGVLAFIPMLQYAGAGIIAIAATGMIYLSYFIGNLALFRARLRGWPKTKAPFSLGRLGHPGQRPRARLGRRHARSTSRGRVPRRTRRPKELPGTLNFHWHWLNGQPVLWTIARRHRRSSAAIYYALVQRNKPAHMQAPEGEAMELPAPVQI